MQRLLRPLAGRSFLPSALPPTHAPTGEPAVPTGANIANSNTLDADIKVQFAAPAADVAGSYYLQVRQWARGATATTETASVWFVTSDPCTAPATAPNICTNTSSTVAGGTTIYVPRAAVTSVSSTLWQITLPRASLFCGPAGAQTACGNGKYSLVAFGALSRFNSSGTLVADYTLGARKAQSSVPSTTVNYGECWDH